MKSETNQAVLIIDDNLYILRSFAFILKRSGYQVDTAKTGEEALRKVSENKYDVALVDVVLPDVNGLALVEELNRHDSDMVKIVITGYNLRGLNRDSAVDACLLKPVNPDDLLELIALKTSHCQTAIELPLTH